MPWSEQGIDNEGNFLSLCYDPSTDTQIAHFETFRSDCRICTVYCRDSATKLYEKIKLESDESVSSVLVNGTKSLLFMNIITFKILRDITRKNTGAADWTRLIVYDLKSKSVSFDIREIRPLEEVIIEAWISALLQIDDNEGFYCIVGEHYQVSVNVTGARHSLCHVAFPYTTYKRLRYIDNPFF